MLVAFSGSHQQALSPPFTAHYSFAADHILLLRPARKLDKAKTLKPVKRYEHLTGDPRIELLDVHAARFFVDRHAAFSN